MGFHFGAVLDLNSNTTHLTILFIVLFLQFFDFLTGYLQYGVSNSYELSLLLNHVYKELMLMGLVSFSIIMIEANPENMKHHEYITSIDCVHIVLFFLVLFTIFHIFVMMARSIFIGKKYYKTQNIGADEHLRSIAPMLKTSAIGYATTGFAWLRKMLIFDANVLFEYEFKVLQSLFCDSHLLPRSFDFSYYLTESLVKYTLVTYERGLFSWMLLLFVGGLNWLRISLNWGLNCSDEFVGEPLHYDDHQNANNISISSSTGRRYLATGSAAASPQKSEECVEKGLLLFFFLGFILAICTSVLRWMSYTYYYHMISKIAGVSGVKEFKQFFELKMAIDASKATGIVDSVRKVGDIDSNKTKNDHRSTYFTYKDVKDMIEEEIYGHEDQNPDAELYRKLTESIIKCKESIEEWLHGLKLEAISTICRREKPTRQNSSKSIVRRTSATISVSSGRRQSVAVIKSLNNSGVIRGGEDVSRGEKEVVKANLDHILTGSLKERVTEWRKRVKLESASRVAEGNVDEVEYLTQTELYKIKKHLNDIHKSRSMPSNVAEFLYGTYSSDEVSEHQVKKSIGKEKLEEMLSYSNASHMKELMYVATEACNEDRVPKDQGLFFRSCKYVVDFFFGKPTSVAHSEAKWQLPINFDDIYALHNPQFFHKCLEATVTLNCAYLAVWAGGMLTIIAKDLPVNNQFEYNLALLLPIIVNIPNIVSCTIIGSILKAISNYDPEIIHATLKEMDEVVSIRLIVSNKFHKIILEMLETTGVKASDYTTKEEKVIWEKMQNDAIVKLFVEVDDRDSGVIGKIEFRNLLRRINIKLDDKSFARLYRSMDLDASDGIKLYEFLRLLSDDHAAKLHSDEYKKKMAEKRVALDDELASYDLEWGTTQSGATAAVGGQRGKLSDNIDVDNKSDSPGFEMKSRVTSATNDDESSSVAITTTNPMLNKDM